jgi:hypothetical protein
MTRKLALDERASDSGTVFVNGAGGDFYVPGEFLIPGATVTLTGTVGNSGTAADGTTVDITVGTQSYSLRVRFQMNTPMLEGL